MLYCSNCNFLRFSGIFLVTFVGIKSPGGPGLHNRTSINHATSLTNGQITGTAVTLKYKATRGSMRPISVKSVDRDSRHRSSDGMF
jgi:hypothetical protein